MSFQVRTTDGFHLTVYKFEPSFDNGKVILISSGIGIQQYFYANYATYLSELGYTVYTYDYRGIGESGVKRIKNFKGNIFDWATLDFQSVTDHVLSKNEGKQKYYIGHSIGGSFLGLAKACLSFDAIVTIASNYGYWKFYEVKYQPLVLAFTLMTIPFYKSLYGYLPSNIKRRGAPVPKEVAKDWATLGLNKHSQVALAKGAETYYDQIKSPMLVISIEDDMIASKKTVDAYVSNLLVNAKVKRRHVLLSEVDTRSIGHSNFFRKRYRDSLWDLPTSWLSSLPLKVETKTTSPERRALVLS